MSTSRVHATMQLAGKTCMATWGRKGERGDEVSLTFDIASPSRRHAQRSVISIAKQAPNNCIIARGI